MQPDEYRVTLRPDDSEPEIDAFSAFVLGIAITVLAVTSAWWLIVVVGVFI